MEQPRAKVSPKDIGGMLLNATWCSHSAQLN